MELNTPAYIVIYNLFPVTSKFVYDIYRLSPVQSNRELIDPLALHAREQTKLPHCHISADSALGLHH